MRLLFLSYSDEARHWKYLMEGWREAGEQLWIQHGNFSFFFLVFYTRLRWTASRVTWKLVGFGDLGRLTVFGITLVLWPGADFLSSFSFSDFLVLLSVPPPLPICSLFCTRSTKTGKADAVAKSFFCFVFWIVHPKFSKETPTNKMPLSHCAGSVRLHAGLALNVYSVSQSCT